MTTIVTYTSKTGFTKTYAEWIATELGADLIETSDLTSKHIANAQVIIHGGGRRASTISGLKKFLRFWPQLRSKHVVLFHTGANPGDPETVETVWKQNLSLEQLANTTRFYLRGGFDFNKLLGIDKMAMAIMRAVLKRKKNPHQDDKGLLALYDNPITELDHSNIKPLVDHVKNLSV